jgi:ribosome biogenesis protein SSF1/2
MGKKQANKDRKATEDAIVAGAKVPRSFVIHRGRVPRSMRMLEKDLRQLMMPYTAKALRESDRNVMKDFVAIAGPLNVSHMMCLSHSDSGTSTLRICRFPRGPTLYFNVTAYSLCRDIISRQRHPFSPGKAELLHSPLVVLNSMQNADKHVQATPPPTSLPLPSMFSQCPLQLVAKMFQNMFPAIDVATMDLKQCRRVLLLNYDADSALYELRHYAVTVSHSGLSPAVRKLVKRKIPNLSKFEDIGDFMAARAALSDSEADDPADAQVCLGKGVSAANLQAPKSSASQAAVRLREIGPRLTMSLSKIEDGFCDGEVIFHARITKTAAEKAELRKKAEATRSAREKRKAEKSRLRPDKGDKSNSDYRKQYQNSDSEGADDDVGWFEREVGHEPSADEKLALSGQGSSGKLKVAKKPWMKRKREKDAKQQAKKRR